MLVSHYQRLVFIEGEFWIRYSYKGCKGKIAININDRIGDRLAMLPIALDADNPGREIMGPMAAII